MLLKILFINLKKINIKNIKRVYKIFKKIIRKKKYIK